MLDHVTQSAIKNARNILVGKITSPMEQCHEITRALVYKFISESDTTSESLGGDPFYFAGDAAQYRWDRMLARRHAADDMRALYSGGLTHIGNRTDIPEAFATIYRDAVPPHNADADTLRMFLEAVDKFPTADTETIGDAFEHLLMDTGAQGKAGQFRTPRHIIDFIVGIIDPQKHETVLDPACGTAGFLASAYQHINKANRKTLSSIEREQVAESLVGYDISPDMVKLATIHMFLHHNQSPTIEEYDTLTNDGHWNDRYDVILANPPFMTPRGAIKPNQRFNSKANKAEVLFVDYINSHLNEYGRAGIIVPEGIVFNSNRAFKALRQLILDESLVAVVSLPSGVFNPYSGVKTSVLILDKAVARRTDSIAFFKVDQDGYDLGAQRRQVTADDLPVVSAEVNEYLSRLRGGESMDGYEPTMGHIVAKSKIAEDGDYNLNGERYQQERASQAAYPMAKLESTGLFKVVSGGTPRSDTPEYWDGDVNWITLVDLPAEDIITEIRSTARNITDAGLTNSSAKIIPANSVVVSARATIGRIGINRIPLATNQGFKNIVIEDTSRAMAEYVAYAVTKLVPEMEAQSSGATYKEITKTKFANLEIPLPPLEVQREIVAEIEGYQRVIDGARQMVDNYRPQIAVDPEWPLVELGNLTKPQYGYTASAEDDGDARFVRITDIGNDGMLSTDDRKYIRLDDKARKLLLEKGDILVSRTGSYGKTMMFNEDYPAVFASYLMRLRFDTERVDPRYYWAFAQTSDYWTQAHSLASGGVQPQFNGNVLKHVELPLPPMEIQQVIADEIASERAAIDSAKALSNKMEQRIQETIERIWATK